MNEPSVIRGDHSVLTEESKLRWFRGLTVEQRYAFLEEQLAIVAEISPHLLRHHAPDPSRSIRILRLP